jgi:hypothetical protein
MSSPQRPSPRVVGGGKEGPKLRVDSLVDSETSSTTADRRGGYPFPSFPGDVDVDGDVPEYHDILEEMGHEPDVVAAVEAHEEELDRLEEAALYYDQEYVHRVQSGELPEMRMPLSPEIAIPIGLLSNKAAIRSPSLRPTLKSPPLSPSLTSRFHPSPIFVYLKKKSVPVSEETVLDIRYL